MEDTKVTYYVYELQNPETLVPFYVGKGSGQRMFIHEQLAKGSNQKLKKNNRYLYNKIRKLLKLYGKILPVKVFETNDETLAFQKEIELIAFYKNKGIPLCNILPGGEGRTGKTSYKHSEETKKLISEKLKGRKCTPEQVEANRQARLKNPVRAWLGKSLPEEMKQKAKESRMKTPEWQKTSSEFGSRIKLKFSREVEIITPEGESFLLKVTNQDIFERFGISLYLIRKALLTGEKVGEGFYIREKKDE